MTHNYEKFNELYIELMKVRQEDSENSHIKLNNSVSVYASSEIVNYYIRTGKFDRIDYISFSVNGTINNDDINFDFILPIMQETLEEWSKLWNQY